ncbi:MAG: DnaJ C-terminal domain-containing protein [Anaerolineales bacterium]|jgi:curved DNA-binding protein
MEYKDYYEILGVERNADIKEIKRAFRKLAQQYHPDKNPNDKQAEETFKEINEAYEVLKDPTKRAKYDQLGASYREWERMGGRRGGFDWSQWQSVGPEGRVRVEFSDIGDLFGSGFSDFFNAIFGGMGQTQRAGRGATHDVEQVVRITLEEAYKGTTRVLTINGRRLEVKIPPGSNTGTKVRIAGQGRTGRQRAGDLYLVVHVESDARFNRKKDDLHVSMPVGLYTAVLGGQVRVPTPAGPVLLTLPPGSQPGQTFRLQGRGMPQLRNPSKHGNLYVRLKIKLPRNLSEEESELFRKLAALREK